MSTVAHGSYIILNIRLLEKMGNSKINGGSKSGVLTTFELLNEHAEKSNRETRLCLGKIANCRQILKPFWMSMAVLWRWEHPGVVGGRATAVLAAAPLPNKGEPSRWGVCTPIAWEIPAGGGDVHSWPGLLPLGAAVRAASLCISVLVSLQHCCTQGVPRNCNASNSLLSSAVG